ncbi:hypothetical protein N781_03615 [Pontibacillus halophilus JSM 076056 = DSM 19796]|uniref:PilZ domain-containing protein n=1 Tax=Pontibacillus halophilus JSM 076056 = DSM 19796 TaxID=1385510 RepID=A0A0A5GEN4_9BACI|nr:PilZ domain-containing protein [Pontibacillus halophilus]KGX91676.1 hypothetical protein N781_03615 [Pontibacillus halophilus JSM 076056 = DSM 19796]
MFYKRNEPFRYTFGSPIESSIEVEQEEKKETYTVAIHDLSQTGARMELPTAVELSNNTPLFLTFTLMEETFEVRGTTMWTKEMGRTKYVGIHLDPDDEWKKRLVNTLKQYARKHI